MLLLMFACFATANNVAAAAAVARSKQVSLSGVSRKRQNNKQTQLSRSQKPMALKANIESYLKHTL